MGKTNQVVSQGNLFPECEVEQVTKKAKPKVTVKQLQEEKSRLKEQIKKLETENAKLKIKADAFDELISSSSLFTTTVVAKSFGWSAQRLNQYLKDKKVQYQQGDVWVLYSKYQNKGYTRICWSEYATNRQGKPLTRAHTYWTSKGLLFIRQLLKNDGLLSD
jgi:phage antirepressor YoqD-like protein